MTPLKFTIDVQNYQLITWTDFAPLLLQRPSNIPDAWDRPDILVREHVGPNRNAVDFKDLEHLIAVDDGGRTAHVHGILRHSNLAQGYQEGDQVWLYECTKNFAINRGNQNEIDVVNLRTWDILRVPLTSVLWVPMYKKLGEEEEFITLSGRAKQRTSDKVVYNLAIVQRMLRHNELHVEIKEIAQSGISFARNYQNLRHIPRGDAITEEICCRIRIIQDNLSAMTAVNPLSAARTDRETLEYSTYDTVEWRHGCSHAASILATPPNSINDSSSAEDDNDQEYEDDEAEFLRGRQELERQVKARLSRGPQRVRSPYQKCNYSPGQCPTPATLFNRPEYTSRLRSHYHVPETRCGRGAAHELHCVYSSARDYRHRGRGGDHRRCLLLGSPAVRHSCCSSTCSSGDSGLSPTRNEKWSDKPPPKVINVPDTYTVERGSRGEVTVVLGNNNNEAVEEFVEMPYEAEPIVFDSPKRSDSSSLVEERDYGVDGRGRLDLVENEFVPHSGGNNVIGSSAETATMMPQPSSPGVSQRRFEQVMFGVGPGDSKFGDGVVDTFADRHFDVAEYDEDGVGVDIFADRHLDLDQHHDHRGTGNLGSTVMVTDANETSGGILQPWEDEGQEQQLTDLNFEFLTSAEDWLSGLGFPSNHNP